MKPTDQYLHRHNGWLLKVVEELDNIMGGSVVYIMDSLGVQFFVMLIVLWR